MVAAELWRLSAADAGRRVLDGELSPAELTEAALARIDAVDGAVRAFVTTTHADARSRSSRSSEGGGVGGWLLAGVPGAIKDNISTAGVRTTCSSRMLGDFVPVYDATVIERLEARGFVMVGKTNLDEFAMGSSTENSAFGESRNPWDLGRVPGGSSGGSAAAVASGQAFWALGSDTGGSIRQPAALCGIVGMKPTYGLVSRYGLVAFASSLDQIGPLTRTVEDSAHVLSAIAGHDARDTTSAPREPGDFVGALAAGVKGMKVGLISDLMGGGVEPEVAERVREAAAILEGLGAEVGEVSLPSFEYALSAYYIIAPAEASSNLARYDGVRYGLRVAGEDIMQTLSKTRASGFGDEVKRRIMLGTYALSAGYYEAYYGQAQKIRTLVAQDFAEAFKSYDVLASPTSPTVAFGVGEKTADPLKMYLSDVCTIPVNLAGLPAISVPCGLSQGLPVGLQLIGPAFAEERLFGAAAAYEEGRGPFPEPPPLGEGI